MKQFMSRSRPRATLYEAPDLERLFGVRGLAAGRAIASRPWMRLFAPDIPAREQLRIGLRFLALGLAPPALLGVALLAWTWVG